MVAPKKADLHPSPTTGHHSTRAPLNSFCGDYPLSLTMSANDRAGSVLKWFLPHSQHTHQQERKWWVGSGFIIPWLLVDSSFVCVSISLLPKRNQQQERSLLQSPLGGGVKRRNKIWGCENPFPSFRKPYIWIWKLFSYLRKKPCGHICKTQHPTGQTVV